MSGAAFAEAVEAAGRLTDEYQAALIDLLQRRRAEAGRRQVAADVREANAEFAAGGYRPASPDDILRDALS
jgi:hypothetical protein